MRPGFGVVAVLCVIEPKVSVDGSWGTSQTRDLIT
jgi:hypothetical protein